MLLYWALRQLQEKERSCSTKLHPGLRNPEPIWIKRGKLREGPVPRLECGSHVGKLRNCPFLFISPTRFQLKHQMSTLAFAQLSLLWNCLCGTLRDKWRLWDNTGLLSSSPLSSQLRVKVPLSSETCPFPCLTAKETDCSCQGFRNCSLWMVQEIKLCFGTSLRKLWGSCLGGNQPKQRGRTGWGWGEVVWSNIEPHHWLLWTRAIRWSPLFVSCVNWIPFTFCLLESDKPSTQQGCGQPFLSWMTSWSSCGVGAEEGDLKGGGLCIPLSAVLKGLYWLGSRGKGVLLPRLCSLCHRVVGAFEERFPHPIPHPKPGEGLGSNQWSGNSQNPVAVWLFTSREMWAVCFGLRCSYHIRLFFIRSSSISKKPVLLLIPCCLQGLCLLPVPTLSLTISPSPRLPQLQLPARRGDDMALASPRPRELKGRCS